MISLFYKHILQVLVNLFSFNVKLIQQIMDVLIKLVLTIITLLLINV